MIQTDVHQPAERAQAIAAEIEAMQAHQAREDAADAREIAYFEGLLAGYYDWLRATDRLGRRTGYPLPEGVLRRRARGITWQVTDPAAFLAWAEAKGLVRTKVEAAWQDIKARLHPIRDEIGAEALDGETGECIPGLVVGQGGVEVFAVEGK